MDNIIQSIYNFFIVGQVANFIFSFIFLSIGLFLGTIKIKLWCERNIIFCSEVYNYNDYVFDFYTGRFASYTLAKECKIEITDEDIEIEKGRNDIVKLLKNMNNKIIKKVEIGKWTKYKILYLYDETSKNCTKVQEIYQ